MRQTGDSDNCNRAHPTSKGSASVPTCFCLQVEDCLQAPNALALLMDLYQANVQQLAELSELVGGNLNDVERRIMVALITIDVHNR